MSVAASPPSTASRSSASSQALRTAAETCPLCGSALHSEQDWCLRCGAAARTRLAGSPNWGTPAASLAAIVVLALGVLAASLVKLAGDSGASPAAITRTVTAPAPASSASGSASAGASTSAAAATGTAIKGRGATGGTGAKTSTATAPHRTATVPSVAASTGVAGAKAVLPAGVRRRKGRHRVLSPSLEKQLRKLREPRRLVK
jgi:hypothetical protein